MDEQETSYHVEGKSPKSFESLRGKYHNVLKASITR